MHLAIKVPSVTKVKLHPLVYKTLYNYSCNFYVNTFSSQFNPQI